VSLQTAVDPVPAGVIRDALSRYGLAPDAEVEFVRHGENTTYRVRRADGRRYALRINRPGYQTAAAIRSELAWMDSLRAGGVLLPPAAACGIDGDPLQTATATNGLTRTAVLLEWIDGVPLTAVSDVAPWERLGELMARIQVHARGWERPPWFERPAWDAEALVGDEPRWGPPDPLGRFNAVDHAALEACRAQVRARLDVIGADPDRFGLIHSDLGFENVLVSDDGTVSIIDFDDCGASWYMHDIAVALHPHDQSDGMLERRDALVAGYRRVADLPDELLAELPTFLMTRRIQSLGWLFSRPETAHAQRQRPRRLASTPTAIRDFLAWAADNPL
jgi:Ser/Thr protein kinase RdoA (MazF antagonist)